MIYTKCNIIIMTLYNTQDEAIQDVPAYIEPKDCFVWQVGNKWQVIPGTGCAHWVSHQKGYTGTPNDDGCLLGYNIKVKNVLSQLSKRDSIDNAQIGDIWSQNGASHIGIVTAVNKKNGLVESLNVMQDGEHGLNEIPVKRDDGECYEE